jgi:hypothetical protein
MPENQCGYCHLISRARADERERAVQRVEAMRPDAHPDIAHVIVSDVIAAIKGESA